MIVTSLNLNGGVEGWLQPLIQRIPSLPDDVAILAINYTQGFVFDRQAAQSIQGKRICILDFAEYGVDYSWNNSHLFSVTINAHRQVAEVAEYLALDEFLKQNQILCYFKREYSQNIQRLIDDGEVYFPVYPIEIFFDNLPPIPHLNRDEYLSRLGGVFHLFGNSHPDRKSLAGEMMKRWERICTSLGKMVDLENARLPYHLVEQVEHLSRYEIGNVLHWQGKCLASMCCAGFGVKSFRMRESCFNSVPIIPNYGIKYSISWSDENAIILPTENGRIKLDESLAKLEVAMRDRADLWSRMQAAHNMAHAYSPDNYVRDQVTDKILQHL